MWENAFALLTHEPSDSFLYRLLLELMPFHPQPALGYLAAVSGLSESGPFGRRETEESSMGTVGFKEGESSVSTFTPAFAT